MTLQDRLDAIERQLLTVIDPQERAALVAVIERLRMLQIVEQGLAVGDLLPDFALPDQTGTVVRLGDFRGRPLLLVFYRGHW